MLLNETTIIFKCHKIAKPLSVFEFCVLYFILKVDTVGTISVRSGLAGAKHRKTASAPLTIFDLLENWGLWKISTSDYSTNNKIVFLDIQYLMCTVSIMCVCFHNMSQLLLLGKFEYGGGPTFKVVLEC